MIGFGYTISICSAVCIPRSNICVSTIHRWDGVEWMYEASSDYWFNDMFGVGNTAFAVATDGFIKHWNGTAWETTGTDTNFDLRSVRQTCPKQPCF